MTKALCECGCGQPTPIAKRNRPERGHVKGEPVRFLPGHMLPRNTVERVFSDQGYVLVYVGRAHPMAQRNGYVKEHRLVMSEAIGRPLRREEQVHHIDHDKTNNSLDNLMLFASAAEHAAHHRALEGVGSCG